MGDETFLNGVKEYELEKHCEGELRFLIQSVEVLVGECCKDALPPSLKRLAQPVIKWGQYSTTEPGTCKLKEEVLQTSVGNR